MEAENGRGTRTTLVLGGTGKTGRREAKRLRKRRLPTRADWEDHTTWAPALGDVGSVYVSYYPDLAVPGAVAAVRAFADTAVEAGVRRLVLLSGRGEEAQRAERAVQEVGAEWTVVRCARFSQNFSESYLLEPILGGEVALPAGEVAEPFVDAGDIADVAVAALIEDGHAGQLYELTGPALLSFEEAVGEIASSMGREIRYVHIFVEEYASVLAEQDVPDECVALLTYLFTEVLDGRNAHTSSGVRSALGREPRGFADYARDAAATGVWKVGR